MDNWLWAAGLAAGGIVLKSWFDDLIKEKGVAWIFRSLSTISVVALIVFFAVYLPLLGYAIWHDRELYMEPDLLTVPRIVVWFDGFWLTWIFVGFAYYLRTHTLLILTAAANWSSFIWTLSRTLPKLQEAPSGFFALVMQHYAINLVLIMGVLILIGGISYCLQKLYTWASFE
jgi:hypothetical protein